MPSLYSSRPRRSLVTAVAVVLLTAFATVMPSGPAAQAAAITSPNPAPSLSNWPNNTTNWPCAPTLDYSCTGGGYAGQDSWGYTASASTNQDGKKHNCTAYVAYRLERDGVANPGALGDAKSWGTAAASKGIAVDQTPAVGAIAQWTSGPRGHVGYVDAVNTDGSILVSSDNYYDQAGRWYGGYTQKVRITKDASVWPANFIHFTPKYGTPTISAVKFHNRGVTATFTAPTVPSGLTITGYSYEVYDATGSRGRLSGDYVAANKSPLLIPWTCGSDLSCKYRIRAEVSGGGASAWSNTVATAGIGRPNISSVKFNDGGVLATFTAPTVPTGLTITGYSYEVYDATGSRGRLSGDYVAANKSPLLIPWTCGSDLSCKYRIRAEFYGGASAWSNTVATTGISSGPKISTVNFNDWGVQVAFTPPTVPSGLTVTGYSWEAYDATGSRGRLWGDYVSASKSPLVIPSPCTSELSCKFRIRAEFYGGASAWSNTVATTGLGAPVLNFTARQPDVNMTTLFITPPALPTGATLQGYSWEVYDATTGDRQWGDYTQGSSPLLVPSACQDDRPCKFRVRAEVYGGASPWSNYAAG